MNSLSEFATQEHKRMDELFAGYFHNRNGDRQKAESFFSQFKIQVIKHIAWEEEVLFPLFQSKPDAREGGLPLVIRLEHQEIKDLLEGIQARLRSRRDGLREFEDRLSGLFREHCRMEEMVLYPSIDQALSDNERQEAVSRFKSLREII